MNKYNNQSLDEIIEQNKYKKNYNNYNNRNYGGKSNYNRQKVFYFQFPNRQ